jgi:hypothetical protein
MSENCEIGNEYSVQMVNVLKFISSYREGIIYSKYGRSCVIGNHTWFDGFYSKKKKHK